MSNTTMLWVAAALLALGFLYLGVLIYLKLGGSFNLEALGFKIGAKVEEPKSLLPRMEALTWDQWQETDAEFLRHTFVIDESVANSLQDLRKLISVSRSVTRLTGTPGLGKTRLALEATRKGDDADSPKTVWYLKTYDRWESVITDVQSICKRNKTGVIVVDDCKVNLHDELSRIIKSSKNELSLLTVDYERSPTMRRDEIVLGPVSKEVIKGILAQRSEPVPEGDLDRIVSLAQGFPRFAVLVADAQLEGRSLTEMNGEIFDRMVEGRDGASKDQKNTIKAASLFEVFSVEGKGSDQLEYAASIAGVTPDEFVEHLKQFEPRGIVQIRGGMARVQPPPLAVNLAAEWWRHCRPERARELFTDDAMPDPLLTCMCDQLKMLDDVAEAKSLTIELCGEQGPFGNAETLNTERGSRCFRSIVEVSPDAAAGAVLRSFGEKSSQWIRENMGPGRRNLVHALEALCFRQDTFERAAKVMLVFAAG